MPRKVLSAREITEIQRIGKYVHNDVLARKYNISNSYVKQLQAGIPKSKRLKSEAQRANALKGAEKKRRKRALEWQEAFNRKDCQETMGELQLVEWVETLHEGCSRTLYRSGKKICQILNAVVDYVNEQHSDSRTYMVAGKAEPLRGRFTIFTVPKTSLIHVITT